MSTLTPNSGSTESAKPQGTARVLEKTEVYEGLEIKRCNIGQKSANDDKGPRVIVANQKFLHYMFEDFAASEVTFQDCDFSYGVFTRAYFYKAKFIKCHFTGARFTDCNFRSATFSQCDFWYASFRGTIIPSKEIASNSPEAPNVRRELMQALRVNASSVGDDDSVKFFIREELQAGEEHNRRAREAREPYYAAKYGWDENKWRWMTARLERCWLWIQRFGWGYGEYPLNLLLTTALLLTLFTLRAALKGCNSSQDFAARLIPSAKYTVSVFLGSPLATQAVDQPMGWVWMSSIVFIRYLAVSLFVAMLFRRLSRR